jgi:hypothetical protein
MMISTTNPAANVSAKPRTIVVAVESCTFAGCDHCFCCCRRRWRHGQLHVSLAVAADSRVSLHRLRAVRALLHSGREQSLLERVRVRLQQNGGRRSPLPERFTLPVSD